MAIKLNQDAVVGAVFVLLGAAFALASWRTLPVGTAAQMGAGFLPFFVGLALLGCGGVLLYQARVTAVGVPTIAWAVLLKLLCLFLMYGAALSHLGLLPGIALLLLGSRLFYPTLGWRRLLALTVVTLVLMWCLVSLVLGLNLPLWPGQY
ncbi:MAG: tripartite tricarboxylate transporter TctB family protein [Neisseriaceae bacterium]|nr:tripartite tricarboxylate transporter TctB family protein [Neisseriaceae bacterium]MBP6861282.1 tripartite tricarboxylate transporter TctB family protein [Neisseriaceae bacterium]